MSPIKPKSKYIQQWHQSLQGTTSSLCHAQKIEEELRICSISLIPLSLSSGCCSAFYQPGPSRHLYVSYSQSLQLAYIGGTVTASFRHNVYCCLWSWWCLHHFFSRAVLWSQSQKLNGSFFQHQVNTSVILSQIPADLLLWYHSQHTLSGWTHSQLYSMAPHESHAWQSD